MKRAIRTIAVLCFGVAGVAWPTPLAAQNASALQRSLELADWTESRFAKFADGEPLAVDEEAEIDRLVQRLANFDRRLFRQPTPQKVTTRQLLERPQSYRGRLVRLDGKVDHTNRRPPDAEAGRCWVSAREDTNRFHIATAQLPAAWRSGARGESMSVTGIFVKNTLDDNPLDDNLFEGARQRMPVIAASRVSWYPTKVMPKGTDGQPEVNYGMSVLGTLGVDVATLDTVKHRRPLGKSDTDAFYEVLGGLQEVSEAKLVEWAERQLRRHREEWAALAESETGQRQALAMEVARQAKEDAYSVAPYFNVPREQVGALATFDGVVRRVLRIEVGGDLDAKAAGIDHYYELALFTGDSRGNPVFFCVTDLPSGFPTGDDLSEPVRVAGFFFKSWRYAAGRQAEGRASKAGGHGNTLYQYAPLFIGRAPLRIVPEPADSRWGLLAGVGFLLLLATVWLAQWRLVTTDKSFARQTLQRLQRSADPPDFNQAAEDAPL